MTRILLGTALAAAALPALAQQSREMGAHVHGVSTVQIAMEAGTLVIDIFSPGMDVVGFEHPAESAEDRAAIANAVAQLTRAGEIVTLDAAAGCLLMEVLAHLHGEDHDHEEAHAHMAGEDHGDHDHGDETAASAEDHGDHDHDHDHDHSEEAAGEIHSEFHARYVYDCADPAALTTVGFPFFDAFAGAEEIEALFVTEAGAGMAELEPGDSLSLN